MSTVTSRLVLSIGAGSAALVAAGQLGLLGAVVLAVAVLGALPLLLITTLALVAVYSPHPARRTAAEKILDRLLNVRRPRARSTPAQRLLGLAVRLLPVAHRARYAEEFRAEILELPRWKQMSYALRLTASVLALRSALRDDAPARLARAPRRDGL